MQSSRFRSSALPFLVLVILVTTSWLRLFKFITIDRQEQANININNNNNRITVNSTHDDKNNNTTRVHRSPTTRKTKTSLKIATWNLRVPFEQDVTTWADRRDSVANAIALNRPDILATQEDCYYMNQDLMMSSIINKNHHHNLSSLYERYGLFNRNGEANSTSSWPVNAFSSIVGRDGEHNSIWYNRNRFIEQKKHTFWMSRSPTVPGTSFDEVTGRIVNCLLLRERHSCVTEQADGGISSCTDVFFCSTHLPSGNVMRQLWSVDVISKQFRSFKEDYHNRMMIPHLQQRLVMFISGDFNAIPGSATYNAMIDAGFVDARSISNEGKRIDSYSPTTNDWHGAKDELIDHVWIYNVDDSKLNHYLSVESVKHKRIPAEDDEQLTASDHKMITVDITYRSSNF
mmetsp:Transcript_20665/g.31277  ORF Transcript_20665/g.31277 Transcript_20665/m.31277 type:complete len:402 (+) Transcript_20665:146-1351(+)